MSVFDARLAAPRRTDAESRNSGELRDGAAQFGEMRYDSRFSQRISSGVSFTVRAGSVVRSSLSF